MKKYDYFLPEYIEEVYRRSEEGGKLYFIKRTDTNQYLYNPAIGKGWRSNQEHIPDEDIAWSDELGFFNLSEAHLSRAYAKEFGKTKLTEGGCRYCHHKAKKIPITIVMQNFHV